jgi:sulfoxide reductase heme-binding subunit YedZ
MIAGDTPRGAAVQNKPKRARPSAILAPLFDRAGRFSPLKTAALTGAVLPAGYLAWQWATADLGAQPILAAADVTGLWTIRLTLITLAISPFRRLANWPRIVLTRRIFGVSAMAYALAHLLFYALDQSFRLWIVIHEIAVRIYLTIGFIAFLIVCMLGLTSTDRWMRRLGQSWKRLHQAIFAIGVLGILHFFMQSKANVSEPVIMTGYFLWLVAWRLIPIRQQDKFLPLVGLAMVCSISAALVEFAWYGLATGVPAIRVLQANLNPSFGVRPAVWVVITGLAIACLAGGRPFAFRAEAAINAK